MALTTGSVTAVRQAIYQTLCGDVDLCAALGQTPEGFPAVYMGQVVPKDAPYPRIHVGRPISDSEGVLNRGGTIQLHDLRCFAKADAWEALDDIGDHLRRLFHARRLDLSVGGCVSCLANGPVDIDDGITTGVSGSVVSLTVTTRD